MGTRNLTDMKNKLYEAFDNAFSAYSNVSSSTQDAAQKSTARADVLSSIAEIAQATTLVEHELETLKLIKEARERGDEMLVEISSGGTPTMSTIRFKPKTGP